MKNKPISRATYLQLVGLVALAENHNSHLEEIQKAALELFGDAVDQRGHALLNDPGGHVSDLIYGGRGLDDLLRILEIEVLPAEKPAPEPSS